jgi:transcriptional regulator with XRE-family HTH domain
VAAKRARLAQRRKAAGYTQESLAEHLGVERSTVARWERAENEPQPWLRPLVAAALGVTADELQALLDDVVVTQAESSDRLSYVLAHPSNADLVSVAQLHERVRQLDERYDKVPSAALLGAAGHVHGQVTLLREHAVDARVRKALFEVEADSATFMGQLVWDVSHRRDHAGARAYLDTAVRAARQVRDPYTEAYATLRMSFLALYGEKDPVQGAALAQRAADVATLISPSLTGLALLHVAEGQAMAGDLRACEATLRKAETQLLRVSAADVAAGYFTPSEFNRLSGSCYLFLDLPDRAEPILRTSTIALADKKKSQAIALGNLALSLIRQRKLDEATATMHRTIDAVELTRGGGGLNLAFTAGRELRQWRHEPWAQDINDRLLALMAAM